MKTLAVLGPLGSGKTTLVNKILALFSNLRILVVVNDVGTENIDASRIRNAGDVKALTAGCIGCSDLPAFQRVIREAQAVASSIDVLLIEPTGIADGNEIRDAVVSVGETFHAITLVDVKHFGRNRALGCMEGQLRVASVVGLTWCAADKVPEEILEFVGHHASGQPVFLNAMASVQEMVNTALASEEVMHIASSVSAVCGCGHHHDHSHVHHHGDHGVYSFSFKLWDDITHADLVSALAPYLSRLVRAKGVVDGHLFDFVQGDLSLGEVNTDAPHGNFIFNKPVEAEVVFGRIAIPSGTDIRSKKERMRDTDVPISDTLAAIMWQLGEYPPVVTPSGEIRVDCEADVVYQLAKREGLPVEIQRKVMGKYLSWRLESAQMLRLGGWEKHPQLSFWKRRLGVNLGYMCAMYPDLVCDELADQIKQVRPAELLAEGLLGIAELSFNEEMAEEKPETVAMALSFGKIDSMLVDQAVAHCLKLSEKNPEWHACWSVLAKR